MLLRPPRRALNWIRPCDKALAFPYWKLWSSISQSPASEVIAANSRTSFEFQCCLSPRVRFTDLYFIVKCVVHDVSSLNSTLEDMDSFSSPPISQLFCSLLDFSALSTGFSTEASIFPMKPFFRYFEFGRLGDSCNSGTIYRGRWCSKICQNCV